MTCHVIDLPGAGSSRFGPDTELSVEGHIRSVRTVVDLLGLDDVAVVGHDSGGLVARHALGGDERVRSLALIDTEHPGGLSWRFRSFVAIRHLPGIGAALGWAVGQPRLRRNGFVLGDAFADRSLLDGEFDELFLQPIHRDPARRDAAIRVLRSFDHRHVDELASIHQRIKVPVRLVWGEHDKFFPVERARAMVEHASPTPPSPSSRARGCSATRSAPPRSPPRCCRSSWPRRTVADVDGGVGRGLADDGLHSSSMSRLNSWWWS